MPSEIMDQRRLSPSSYFYEEIRFPAQRQVGFWKPESMPDHHGVGMDLMSRTSENKSVVSPSLEKLLPIEAHSMETMGLPHPSILRDQKAKLSLGQHVVGSERTTNVSMSSWRSMDHNVGSRSNSFLRPASYFVEGNKVGMNGIQYERELFSSSLSELFNRKLKLSSNGAPFGQSADALTSHYEEEEPLESLEEIEARTIGNLLPDDDDLLSGAFDEFEYVAQPNNGDDIEDFDLFSSGGGMELEGDDVGQKGSDVAGGISNSQQGGSIVGEHPYGEHPSRTLFVRNINSNVEDSELKVLFEQYGDIRALYTACKHRGFVMISYYDIRAARNAMRALQNKPLRRRKLDIHYSIPKDNPSDRDINQGTLVVFNLDSSVSNDDLRQIFGVYGEIKEIRETPHKHHHKFIEFYDVRAADAALRALNRTDIAGKRIKLEPSRPGGSRRSMMQQPSQELDQEEAGAYQQWGSPADNSGSFGGNHSGVTEPSTSMSQINFGLPCIPTFHPHSLPEFHDGLVNGIPYNSSGTITAMAGNMSSGSSEVLDNRHIRIVGMNGYSIEPNEGAFSSSGNGSFPHHGHHYVWSNSNPYHPHSPSPMMLSNSPLINGVHSHPTPQLHGLPIAPSHVMSTVLPISHHHVGSAPAINPSIWDRRHSYAGESPEASGLYPGSFGGGMGLPSMSTLHPLGFTSHNIFPHIGGNSMDPLISSTNIGMHSPQQRCHMFQGMPTSFDAPNERVRSRRNEAGSSQIDNKKQFELDIDRILSGEETRTTLMIKNIPNKYTSKMLLAAIDERHKGTYDFIYLPIDFKNKCNVGYAFINMIDPQQIVPFYQAFNGKKWEKFNSEKVASLAYGRIQGKAALIAHFQNSSLMNEDKRCRPILFHSDGPNAGDQEPFPMAMNIRSRASKSSSSGNEENNQGSPSTSAKGDESSKGMELSSGYVKDSE